MFLQPRIPLKLPIPSLDLFGFLSSLGTSVKKRITYYFDTYINLINVNRQNRVLKERLRLYRMLERELLWVVEENRRLRKLLSLKERWPSMVVSNIVGGDYFEGGSDIFVSFGSRDGAKVGMVVVSKDGLLGDIYEVGFKFSKIRTVLSKDFLAGVEVVPRGIVALYRGGDPGNLEYVYQSEKVYPGDLVVTSGVDGRFPPGIPVGIVSYVAPGKYFKVVKVVPFSRVKNERFVGIITR